MLSCQSQRGIWCQAIVRICCRRLILEDVRRELMEREGYACCRRMNRIIVAIEDHRAVLACFTRSVLHLVGGGIALD